jgi:TPR repeat protein
LGNQYVNGKGVDQSDELAREWWIKAAVQDDERALQNLQILDKQEGQNTVAPIAPLQIVSHGAILRP